jgi:hypothetical protein
LARDTADLANELQKLQSEFRKLGAQAILFDVEQAFKTSLVLQETALGEIAEKLKQAAGSGTPGSDQLREAARALTKMSETEDIDVTNPAQQIASVVQLLARADVFVRLAKEEATIAQMLRRFAESTNALTRSQQIEVQELTEQQRRIKDELGKMLASLPESLEQIPKDEQFKPLRDDVEKFLKAVEEAKIEEDIGGASKALGEHDVMTGHVLAKSAAEKMDKLISKCRGDMRQSAKQCLRFQPKIQQAFGNTFEQILAAMGLGQGQGQGGQDGYGLFNEDVALYGPNAQVAGEQAGGRGTSGEAPARDGQRLASDPTDRALPKPGEPGRVRLQPNAKFPLKYREVVGEYFKAIAETEEGK